MSMVTQRDYLARNEYYQDQRRAAQQYRLARLALDGRNKGEGLYCRALAWLGHRLVAWGSRLQTHYGAVMSSSTPQSAGQAAGR